MNTMRTALSALLFASVAAGCGNTNNNPNDLSNYTFVEADNGKAMRLSGPVPGDGDSDGFPDCSLVTGVPDAWCDCNDGNAGINPGVFEDCDDGVDNDCDGLTDADDIDEPASWGPDLDGDGFGTLFSLPSGTETTLPGCDFSQLAAGVLETWGGQTDVDPATLGVVQVNFDGDMNPIEDCDDGQPAINPAATEVCNDIDDDCDGQTDEEVADPVTYYADDDGDGFGDPEDFVEQCGAPSGFVENDADCNDDDDTINPDATERPGDGVDQNCDSQELCFVDNDDDGFGAGEPELVSGSSCAVSGFAATSTDCDDSNEDIRPSAAEYACNGIDDDCDGLTDDEDDPEDLIGFLQFYEDGDGDGFGAGDALDACEAPSGFVDNNEDCNDEQAGINPAATETCDGLDNDCDGDVDDRDDDTVGQTTWYVDADNDNFGNADGTIARISCEEPALGATNTDDCDDFDADVNPGAEEILGNGIDDDCDPSTDDGVACDEMLTVVFTPPTGSSYGPTMSVRVKTFLVDDGDTDMMDTGLYQQQGVYELWQPETTIGDDILVNEVQVEADGSTFVSAEICADEVEKLWLRLIDDGQSVCTAGGGVLTYLDGQTGSTLVSPSPIVTDPVDGGCAQQIPIAGVLSSPL